LLIKSIKLQNYRNYEHLNIVFDHNINVFYGDNGQGKTNILEALFLSGTTKSHRGTKDKDLIQFGFEEAHLEIVIEKNNLEYVIDMHLKKNTSKGIAINKVSLQKASDLFGIGCFVFFSPEDLNIIKAGPTVRRRFMDLELSQLDCVYLSYLLHYNKIINQRNTLLKNININHNWMDTLDVWDLQLIEYGNKIMYIRNKFILNINKIISNIHKKLTNDKEELKIIYEKSIGKNTLEESLKKNREKDIRFKSTSVGPHRDDLFFISNGINLRQFGSQGQQRTAALSLKLAELELAKELTQDTPVLLLDDVLSELDKHRQNCLLESIKDIQTMITCTGLDEFVSHSFGINKKFQVINGKVYIGGL